MLKPGGALPRTAREFFRQGNHSLLPTSGFCEGYTQANLAIVSSDCADEFDVLCRHNSGPLPLLYKSDVGELTAGPLATDSNVQTDLAGYRIVRKGLPDVITADIQHLDISNFVSFYLGCSYTFEKALLENAIPIRNMEEGKNVSMHRTNIDLIPAGRFHGRMVVSMRPIPKDQLSLVCSLCHPLNAVHGCPIHIGNPLKIGVVHLDLPTYGDAVSIKEDEVPVFWCCGATVVEVVNTARLPQSITHAPGCMFIGDQAIPEYPEVPKDSISVHCIDHYSQYYGICGKEIYQKLIKIEEIISTDPGKRGISALRFPDDFVSACFALSQARSVLLTTGFACATGDPVPFENDGPIGTVTLAKMLHNLGKKVTIFVEAMLVELMQEMVRNYIPEGADDIRFVSVPESYKLTKPFDVYIAIERSSRGMDGNYYTMKARPLPKDRHTQPAENIFLKAKTLTIGIGDGGNELGMGKAAFAVRENIPNGEIICSAIATDLLIAAGVSNWGAWGLAFGLRLLSYCPIHDRWTSKMAGRPRPPPSFWDTKQTTMEAIHKISQGKATPEEIDELFRGLEERYTASEQNKYKRKGLGYPRTAPKGMWQPTVDSEKMLLELTESLGMLDGITKYPMHVDAMDFNAEHTGILRQLTELTDTEP